MSNLHPAPASAKVIPLFGPHKADISKRGYLVAYRGGGQDWCPGCGRQHWLVGRMMAECAFCGTAIPLNLSPDQTPLSMKAEGRR